ncbi:MAG TPA: biopolymer transporter ExbD [Rhodopirellula sp.]|jgi:biopolymer transport protein ExbD|nr:biopolymer transporter ExbD [Planctomycetaceae bacterium]MDB4653998.1 biopolymer transporter ExbD [bacterium]MDB4807674.1 biopolymer transporter ExbD [bacterium]HBV62363.1 biopolymer transporter ExbD [Rhodopirellula sp.]|tara:strand:- start:521 stop:958 length:438 start_codon:yes stop_codon:yes gene_type:complete
MKVKSKKVDLAEGDLTPMIDMVFQLIAFFMVLINFAQTESNDRVKLPSSQLVKPPEVPLEFPIILHVAQDGEIILGGDDYTAETLRVGLQKELAVIKAEGKTVEDANVVIRAHKDTSAGDVQEVIRVAQEQQLENFALRVKEDNS